MMDPATVCIALAIYFEARGEPPYGQLMVADVIKTRVESERYPDHACDVVFQGKQFSFVHNNTTPAPVKPDGDFNAAWQNALDMAESLEKGWMEYPNIGATHYHSTTVKPFWAKTGTKVLQVGHHVFYKSVK